LLADNAIALEVERMRAAQWAATRVANILVSRDQFNVTPEGITHKPTGASFIPDIGNPLSGSIRPGQLESERRTGDRYDPETVKRMMRELWAEYVEANPTLFNTSSPRECQMKRPQL
jgi:hypothetical protein